MNSYSCFIFDMDGTITNTNRLIFDSFNHIVETYGGALMTDREIAALFGPPEEGALEVIVGHDRLGAAMDRYLKYYRDHHHTLASVYTGMPEVLRDLHRKGVALALFTGKGRHTTEITLEMFGLRGLFRKVVTGNDVVRHKPSGEGIESILREFEVSKERTVMVGDSPADIFAAREAGVAVASVLWDPFARERVLQHHRDFTFHNVEEFGVWASQVASNGH
jgi:HAD superfamily hydrolase (TIGR01509 family)